MRLPNTLFFRTATTLTLALLLLSIIFVASAAYFVMVPVGKRSADDLSALLELAAKTWVELPPQTRPDFVEELQSAHSIQLVESTEAAEISDSIPIYIYLKLLKNSLQKRLGEQFDITIGVDKNQPDWVWINIPFNDEYIRFGISVERIGARPPVALIAMGIAILVLALGTALILARRLIQPLEALSNATDSIGRGEQKPIDEAHGPDEIRRLAHNFNRMAQQVSDLLENRTTLLAGISHDLRTPLTRLRLALEIHAEVGDDAWHRQLEQNIEEMEQLLEQALQLARGISKKESPHQIELVDFLATLASQLEAQYPDRICFETSAQVGNAMQRELPEQTLLRILHNLIGNALRYGAEQAIVIRLDLHRGAPQISILDRGPGIPEDQLQSVFRPFYRLEQSRNLQTGGSGLGLAIVQQLAQAHGWQVSMLRRDGGGNEARLWLDTVT
jgi:two-component system osmolarity sensor histidine kinase EnvZ